MNPLEQLAAIAGVEAPVIRKVKALNPCLDCNSPMISAARYRDGERTGRPHMGRGLCGICYKNRRTKKTVLPPKMVVPERKCVVCGIGMYTTARRKTEGLRRHAAQGRCSHCYKPPRKPDVRERRLECMAQAEARLVACSECERPYGTPSVGNSGNPGQVHVNNIGLNLCRMCDSRRITKEGKRKRKHAEAA